MDTDSSAEIDQDQAMANHPLQHFLVLQALFRYDSSPGTIKRNRLVSRSWREASAATWVKLDKNPVLRYSDLAEQDVDDLVKNDRALMTLSEFYSLYEAGDPTVVQMLRNPPQKLLLHMWQFFGDNALGNNTLDKWFWTWTTTKSLHKVTLVDTHFKQEVTVLKESFLRGVPNLEELTLRNCIVHQEALGQVNEEHNRWMEYSGREDWIMTRRLEMGVSYFDTRRALSIDNYPSYYPNSYRHDKLASLDVTLKVAQEPDSGTGPKPPLRIWGPLLAMLPCLRHLRIGGYEETEAPPPQLKQLDGDDYEDWQIIKFESFDEFVRIHDDPSYLDSVDWFVKPWIGRYIHDGSPITLPCHRGYFWELFWEQEIGQIESSLNILHLLDFSGTAQEYGVLSACEAMDHVKKKNGLAEVFKFSNLKKLAFDLGLDVTFAENDIRTLNRWLPLTLLNSLELYRAPFGMELSSVPYWCVSTNELKLWGNVSPNLNFLRSCHPNFKLIWITSCFENEFCGKRLHHLLKSGRQATPLMRQDLVERTDWEMVLKYDISFKLYHLEMDWGPISLESWGKLGRAMPNLTFLKGIVADDKQLDLIVTLWPELKSLKLAHGSRVTSAGLLEYLPKLKLKTFEWTACTCTQEHFQVHLNIQELRQSEMELKKRLPETDMKLPWKLEADAVEQTGCILAEWENALLTGNSTKFFELYKNARTLK